MITIEKIRSFPFLLHERPGERSFLQFSAWPGATLNVTETSESLVHLAFLPLLTLSPIRIVFYYSQIEVIRQDGQNTLGSHLGAGPKDQRD